MSSKESNILKYLTELFDSIPKEFFNHMFVGYIPFGNLTPDFDWLYSNRDTQKFHEVIRSYHLLSGAVEMAFWCDYIPMFNTATWKVRLENV